MRLFPVFCFLLFLSLTACEQNNSQVAPEESTGLPPAQQQQNDAAAGVKFGDKQPFKSLSDSE